MEIPFTAFDLSESDREQAHNVSFPADKSHVKEAPRFPDDFVYIDIEAHGFTSDDLIKQLREMKK